MKYIITKKVEAKDIRDALKKEARAEIVDIRAEAPVEPTSSVGFRS